MENLWLKSYPPAVPKTIDPDKFSSLIESFDQYQNEFNHRIAFANFGAKLSYGQLKDQSQQLAAYLQKKLNLTKGDRVAIMLPNILQYPVAIFAILQAGCVVVNINPLYTARELKACLKKSSAKAIIALANFAHLVAKILPETNLEHIIVTEVADMLPFWKKTVINGVVRFVQRKVPKWRFPQGYEHRFNQVMHVAKNLNLQAVKLTGQDLAILQFTGGTTGQLKAAMLSHRNILANIEQCLAWIQPLSPEKREVVLCALPLYHIFSLTVCCFTFMAMGGHCLLITDPRDIKGLVKTLSRQAVNVFVGLNTLFNHLLSNAGFKQLDFSKQQLTISGGTATQRNVAQKWQELTGNVVVEGYGLTECSPVVTINPINLTAFNGSIGLPVPSTEVSIRDQQGNPLDVNEEGELWVRGPQVMLGYWQDPVETAKVLDPEGWLHSGDMARIDEAGFVYIIGRIKEMILVSGFNVYPHEVEDIIAEHPAVSEVAVFGVPNELTGETIKAVIVKKDPQLSEIDILTHCRASLTGYKIPKIIEFSETLPKSHVGKILRKELRDNHVLLNGNI